MTTDRHHPVHEARELAREVARLGRKVAELVETLQDPPERPDLTDYGTRVNVGGRTYSIVAMAYPAKSDEITMTLAPDDGRPLPPPVPPEPPEPERGPHAPIGRRRG